MGSRGRLVGIFSALALVLGALYVYDRAQADVIADGIEIAGVDVGGMTVDEAAAAVGRRAAPALSQSVTVRHGARRFVLTRRAANVTVHARESAGAALARSREGSFLSRSLRSIAGQRVEASITPKVTYSSRAVRRFVHDVEHDLEVEPEDARVAFSGERLRVVGGSNGRSVKVAALERAVRRELTLLDAPREIRVPTKVERPRVGVRDLAARYPWVIAVHRPSFKLRVFRRLEPHKTYSVSVGQIGYTTPAGLYSIQNKAIDPVWDVPDEPWAGELRGRQIPPGPENPIKARWLGVYDGVGIHGTAEAESIGTRASRGCIRMRIEDVKDLYRQIPVGTPIYIE